MTNTTIVIGKNSNLSNYLIDKLNNSTAVSSRDIMSDVNILAKYKNQKICDPIHAISAKIKFKVTSGEFLKMTKNNKNIIFCHSEQFNDQRSYKYLNGKKIK